MLKRKGLIINLLIFLIFIIALIILYSSGSFLAWAQNKWLDVLYALILAVIIGALIEYIYRKISPSDKFAKETLTIKPQKTLAKLVLPNKNQLVIINYERIFGREDFLGSIGGDKLAFIGKKHFKITKMDDGFYIEDLNTKNGTKLNNEHIGELGKKKLEDGDEICVANVLKITYHEKET
jgi:pSer/pThr/pTyr-binding forkhead associated (FHA) protein